MYRLKLRHRFIKIMKQADLRSRKMILTALERLAQDPFQSPNVRRLSNVVPPAYRLRVGRWRVLYFIVREDETLDVVDVFVKKSEDDYRQRGF